MQRSARAQVLMQIGQDPTLGPLQDPLEALRRIYDAVGMEEPDKLIKKQQGPSPQEQIMLEGAAAKVARDKAGAAKDAATAEKTQVETQLLPSDAKVKEASAAKTIVEAQLLPADQMLKAHAQDMADAHKQKDREQAEVVAADKKATEAA